MKLHLPLGLRAALLAVLTALPFAHGNTFQMEGFTNKSTPANGYTYYNWDTFWRDIHGVNTTSGTFESRVIFDIFDANWELNKDAIFAGGADIKVNSSRTVTITQGQIGRNSDSNITLNNGNLTINAANEISTWGNAGIGYGEDTTHTIVLSNGGTFTLNGGYIARNKSRAEITVGTGSTFDLRDGYVASESGTSALIDISGTFSMSGGRIGNGLSPSKGTAEVIVRKGGAFKMSDGRLGYSGSIDLKVESGGTMVVSDGDFSLDDRGSLTFSGNGLGKGEPDAGSNAALCVTGKVPGYVRHHITIDGDTTFNTYRSTDEITFVGQFTLGGNILTKVGQGTIIFTDARDSLQGTSSNFNTTAQDGGTFNVNRGIVKLAFAASDAFADYAFNLNYGGNVTGTLFVAEGGSYVVKQLGGGITNDNNVTDGRGALTGGGTLIIDYSGESATTSAANVVEHATEGAPSITKRGSGEQQITGAVAAKDISVEKGTLTLGSAGHGVTAESFSIADGAALKLGGNTTAGTLSATGGSISASGSLTLGQVEAGAQLTDITMANGGTLAVGGGTLSSGSVTFEDEGTGTLTVNLTHETHLDFGEFTHGSITLTLSDTYLQFEDGARYQLFTEGTYNSAWGASITLTTTTIGRKTVAFDAEHGSLSITGSGVELTWTGGNFTWQDAEDATSDWQTEDDGTDRFYTGDTVTFASAQGGTVTLSGAIIAEQMSVKSGEWNFTGGTSLEVVTNLTVAEDARATIAAPTTVGGNVDNAGTLVLNGEAVVKGDLLSEGSLTAGGNVDVTGSIELTGGTAQFSGAVTANKVSISDMDETVSFSSDYDVYAGQYTGISNSTVVFNGSSTRISALNITDGSHVTFSGTGLTLGNFYQDIDGGSEVHLKLDLSAQGKTTSSSAGYALSPYIRLNDENSRFVVHGYVNGQDITYKYRQNYNSVSGKGTLVMLDTGYQVQNGDTPAQTMDGPRYGDGILSRFLLRSSSATDANTIRVLELASSENSAHPTVVVFDTYNSYAGYLLKHAKELHVKNGASLGFAYRYDSEYGTTTGPRNMMTTYAPNLVLHLAGTGAASGTERTGKGAALFLTDADGRDTSNHTVTIPWKIVLDAATTINTVTTGAELLFTNELTNAGGHVLTKAGKGKLTLGSGFRTAEGSSGRIDVAAGTLALGYADENALKDFSLFVEPGSGTISLQGGSYVVKFLGNITWTGNATPNSMISGSGTLVIDMPSDTATANIGFAETATGEKVTLVKRGGGSQTLRGAATLDGLAAEGGTLILNGATTAATLTGKGGNLTVSSLTADKASGTLGTLSVAAGGTLQIGGGTLSGESLAFTGAGTLNVSLAGKTHLNFGTVNLGGTLRLELADLFAPDGLDAGSPYQLFDAESWDSAWDANVSLASTQLGRLTVGFENGAIVVTSGKRGDLTWASDSANTWQAAAGSDLFWTNADGAPDFFYNGDNVTFTTTAEAQRSISVTGPVTTGNMTVTAGAWNFAVGSSLAVAGKLTLAAGTGVTFSGASATLQNGAEVGSGATLTFSGSSAALGGTLELKGGTLSLSAASTTISGSIVATGGSVSVTSGAVSSTGSITLGSGESTATMAVSSTGNKSLGDVTVHAGSVFTVSTATGWQTDGTRVSGAGTLALNSMGYHAVGADAGLLGSFISTTTEGVGTTKLGVLSLSANSAFGFSGSGVALTNALSRIEEIHVGKKGSLGFVTGGGRAFEGTTGVLHLSGSGTGAGGEKYEEGINAALYVGNGVTATMPWDVVLDDENTVLNPINASSILYFTGALTSAGNTITKNGQGSIILSNTFTTKPADGSKQDTGTIAVYRGTLTLDYTDEAALSGYIISLARGNTPIGTLTAEAGGRYVIKGITNAGAYEGGYITGGGTLAIDTAGESYTTSASVEDPKDAEATPALTLEKLGKGTQSITGDAKLAALKVTEGTLALGSKDKTVTVSGKAAVEGTLSMGTSLTLGTLSGAGTVTGSGTLAGDLSAFTGSIETAGTWQLTEAEDATPSSAVALQASFAGSGSIALGYAEAESILLSGAAKESVSIDHSGKAALTLTGKSTSTGELKLHDNAAQLGTAAAAAAWQGTVTGSGELKLVHGTLGQALTNSDISLHVDARGAVNAGGTAGAALKSVAIREGGSLAGVSGEITVSAAATRSMELTLDTPNMGASGQALIESGDVHVGSDGHFAVDFTSNALVEILKMDGADVRMHVVSGGALDLGDADSLESIVTPGGYANLLLAYDKVETENGELILKGIEKEDPPVTDPDEPVDPEPPVVDPDEPVDPEPPVVDPDEPVDPNPPVVDPDEPVDPNPPVVDPDEPVDPNPPVVDPDEPVDPNPPVVDPDEPVDPNPPVVEPDEPVTPEPPAKRVYLVLADGSADAATIRDYAALDNSIATVLDAGTQLTLMLADSEERANTITVKNLVGLSGASLVIQGTGSKELTVVLDNTLQDVKDTTPLPGGMDAESARGFDTEFEGLIIGKAGVNFVKTGAGTLTVGSKPITRSLEQGGVQIQEDLEIQQGGIVIRGGGASSVGSLSFNYNSQPEQESEKRGLTVTGSGLTAGALNERGERGEDNAISLQQSGELILTGQDRIETTSITAGEGGGTLSLTETAALEVARDAKLADVDVQVEGGELNLVEGAGMDGGALSIYSGGSVTVGQAAAIRNAGDVDMADDSTLTVSADSAGLESKGELSMAKKATLKLGEETKSSFTGINGEGAVRAEKGATLAITGSGSEFSGELSGSGTLQLEDKADLTLTGITTGEDSRWDSRLSEGATLTVDVTESELDTTLGDITLQQDSKLIYKFNSDNSARLNAHLVIEGGESAELVIESRGRAVEDGEQLNLSGLTYSGSAQDLSVKLKGSTFAYFSGSVLWDGEDGDSLKLGITKSENARNKFLTGNMEANARAGATLLWAALNPNSSTWAYTVENPEEDLAKLINSTYDRAEERQDVSRELAAAAGSAVSTIGAAAAEDLRHQLGSMRNRAAMSTATGKSVWLSAESSYHKQDADGLAPGYTLNGWGGSVGYEAAIGRRGSAGVSLTAMYNDLKTSAADHATGDMDTTYLGAWTRVTHGAWVHSFIATVGMVDATLNRTVSYAEGFSYSTHGSTDGYSLGAMYELGYTHILSADARYALQPVANIQLRHTALSAYSESGSDAGLGVDSITQTAVTLGFGVRLQGELTPHALGQSARFEARLLAKADVGDRSGEATTRLLHGDSTATVKSAEVGATGVELGAGLSLPLHRHGSIFADASAELRSGYSSYTITAGYKLSF